MSDQEDLIRIERRGDVACIGFRHNEIERTDLAQFESDVRQLIDGMQPPLVVIDFQKVEYMSTVMLGSVIGINKWVRQKDGKLCLASLSPMLRQLFEVSGLTRVFEFHDSVDSAVESLT